MSLQHMHDNKDEIEYQMFPVHVQLTTYVNT